MKSHKQLVLLLCTFATCTVANAATSAFSVHTGIIGVEGGDSSRAFAHAEYRLPYSWHGLRPWTGLLVTNVHQSWFLGAGIAYDLELNTNWNLTFGFGPFYYHRGHGIDLGLDLEFYSFIEASRTFANGISLGLRLGHFSNAGLGSRNPGIETLGLIINIPFG